VIYFDDAVQVCCTTAVQIVWLVWSIGVLYRWMLRPPKLLDCWLDPYSYDLSFSIHAWTVSES
jgi:hypothetical protein